MLLAGGLGPQRTLRGALLFDPAREAFDPVPGGLRAPRQQHTATPLPGGRVLLLGGWGGEGNTLADGEVYHAGRNCFAPLAGAMRFARRFHTATALDGKRVLVAGGASDREVLTAAEVFHLSAERSAPCG